MVWCKKLKEYQGLFVPSLPAMQETWVQPLDQESWAPGEGNGNPLQYSCLENPMNRRAWQVTVRRVTKSQWQLSNEGKVYLFRFLIPNSLFLVIMVSLNLQMQGGHLSNRRSSAFRETYISVRVSLLHWLFIK